MEIISRDKNTKRWTEVHWLARLSGDSSHGMTQAGKLIERELLELWSRSAFRPESGDSAGLVFPADRRTIRRVHTQSQGKVQVGYAIANGVIVAGVVLHIDNAIGGYADGSVNWATGHFGVPSSKVAFIRSLVVSPEARSFGIGRLLLRQTVRRAKLLGAEAVIAHLRVSPGRDERLALAYEEAGFSAQSDAATMTIRRTSPNRWVELVQRSRESPFDVNDLPSEVLELEYVCVGTLVKGASRSEEEKAPSFA